MRKRPWYEAAFSADYLARYKHRSDSLARAELPFVMKALKLPRKSLVLDLCCGAGRHSRAMIKLMRSGRVVGLDLSPELLRAAQTLNCSKRRLSFIRGDMRKLPLSGGKFDGVVNLFTSFGYFETDAEHLNVLREVARILKPGGRMILDFFNREHLLATLVPQSESEVNGEIIVQRRSFDRERGRLIKTIRRGKQALLRESVRAYSVGELRKLLREAGLRPIEVYGDLSGARFEENGSPRCVWLSEKP